MKNPRINKGDRQPTVQTQIIYALIHRPSFVLSFIPFLAALGTFAASAQTVFVVNSGSGNVSVIQAASNTVIDTVPVGVRPMHAEVSPDGRRVYVSNQGSDTVSVIDVASRAVVATIPVGHSPFGVAASLD